ncbi:CG12134 [Drosophila busckii]|uniref:WD repeat-containing protein 89 n=1 Tax=Drosophila busckii TaxID=30019 RepID=A0A0M4E3N5_DROBS|nr:WD repeat-containing protein 89 [Drosophila busckii]ALC40491.1 CG12134 [Drosophila busckii]
MTDFNKYCAEVAAQLPKSDDEEDAHIDDKDTCSAQELAAQFRCQYAKDEASLSLKKDYVLGLCADAKFTRLAAGLSNTSVKFYDLNEAGALTAVHVERVPPVAGSSAAITICGVRFLDESADTLLVGSTDGVVRLFDLRAAGEQTRFVYKSVPNAETDVPPVPNSICCFDSNANGRVICCGTEQYMGNVHLLFFDVRERKQLGGYYESHQDDVTTVRFHNSNPDMLCSGGTDGLINVFDIKQPDEDEALLNTINTESSVHRLNWHKNVYDQDIISCITHTNDFKSYESLEGDEALSFDRSAITAGIRRTNAGNFNLINAHSLEEDGVFLLAGTNFNRGEILRSVTLPAKDTLNPLTNFVGNKQIVRESLYDAKRQILITGGESGIITVWTPDASDSNKNSSQFKSKSKAAKTHKKTPY